MGEIEHNPLVDLYNAENLKRLFPRGSKDFIDVNRRTHGPQPKPTIRDGADGKAARKEKDTGRYVVSITAYRARLCDPDNLVGKYFVDALRYAGLIPDDRAEDITYSIRQKKVPSKTQEKTLVCLEKE